MGNSGWLSVWSVLGLASVLTVGAQEAAPPEGWKWVTDSPAVVSARPDPKPGEFSFTTMAPGWHITSWPGAVLFEPSVAVSGRFVVESETFLFPGTSQEGFGIFVGGQRLDASPRYVAFLIRRDGSAAVERRDGAAMTMLQAWARHAALAIQTDPEKKGTPTRNVLRVEAEASQVVFLVNGTRLLDVPRDAGFDGVVGLRIGAELNLHVTNLDVTRRLALPRRPL